MSKRQQIQEKPTVRPTIERQTERTASVYQKTESEVAPMIFDKQNYMLLAAGAALVGIGLLLMSGGKQPDANTWDASIIYNPRIISIAPIVILAGLGVTTYGIFKK
jgi:hypothetical protein